MNPSLTYECFKQIESSNIKNIYEVIPSDLYHTYVDYLRCQNFSNWKNKIKLVNLEVNLEDMEVEQDMYFDEPTYHIFVKNKIDDEDLMDTEFELVHEFHNPEIYELYYNIAKTRNILDVDEEYF